MILTYVGPVWLLEAATIGFLLSMTVVAMNLPLVVRDLIAARRRRALPKTPPA